MATKDSNIFAYMFDSRLHVRFLAHGKQSNKFEHQESNTPSHYRRKSCSVGHIQPRVSNYLRATTPSNTFKKAGQVDVEHLNQARSNIGELEATHSPQPSS